MAKSGTFSKSWDSGWWSTTANKKKYNWSGNWERSGNTLKLTNMKLWMTFTNASWGSGIKDDVTITGGTKQTVTWTFSNAKKSNTVSLNNVNISIGASDGSKTVNCAIAGETTGSVSISFDKAPTGMTWSVVSRAWDTTNNRMVITGKAAVGAWNGTGSSIQFIVNKVATNMGDRWAFEVATTGTSGQKACYAVSTSTHNSVFNSNGNNIPIKGCMTFYPGYWVNNTAGCSVGYVTNTAYYTPPSPLTAFSKTSSTASSTANSITHNFSMTGGTSGSGTTGNNYAVNVTNYYRYSTDDGSTWSAWTSAGTGTTNTSKTFSFTSVYGAKCKVQAKQTYQSLDSAVKELSFTATAATAPSGLAISVKSKKATQATFTVSISGYGAPSSVDGRYIEAAILNQNSYGASYRWATLKNVTSGDITVSNSSSTNPSTFTIAANTTYYYGCYATNKANSASKVQGQFTTCPPDLSALSSSDVKSTSAKISYTYTKAGSALTESFVYTINGGAEQSATAATSGSVNLTGLSPATTYTIVARLKTTSGYSDNSKTITFTTPAGNRPAYCSVGGKARKVKTIYCSVGGKAHKVTKIYGSVNGKAVRIW